MTRRDFVLLTQVLLCAIALVCSGCSPSIPTGTVAGRVVYRGAPVPEGCLVAFVSDAGFAALGTVDAVGNYKLMMAGKPNIPAAKYRVTVTVPGVTGPIMTPEDEQKFMAGDPATVAKFKPKKNKPPLPEKYSDIARSGLSFEIKRGSNTFNIELN